MRALLLAGVVALGWMGAASAATFTDTWSFTDQNGGTVAGTLSGIQNGAGLTAGDLTATVTQASYADLLGPYTENTFGTARSIYNTYSASNGIVTSANFSLQSPGGNSILYFGTDPGVTYDPQVYSYMSKDTLGSPNKPDIFALQTTSTQVPEPASLALLGVGVFGTLAAARRRRRR